MDITLVRAPLTVSKYATAAPAVPPIGLAYLAASLLRAGHKVAFIDPVGEAIDHYVPLDDHLMLYRGLEIDEIVDRVAAPQVIGVSTMFSQDWLVVRKLIGALHERFPEVPIVAGGEHVTAEPEFSMEDAPGLTYIVAGEGDLAICELLEHLEGKRPIESVSGIYYRRGGEICKTPPTKRIREIAQLPWPAWHLVPLESYLASGQGFGVNRGRNMPLIASRGCPYQCTFCSNPLMWTTRWTVRPPADVLAEIKHYVETYHITNIDFFDLTAIIKKEWIVAFCKLLIAENLNICWQLPVGTRSEALDGEVAKLLVASGCKNITYAPESGNDAILKKIKKKVHKKKVLASARGCVKAGCNVKFNFIFGFPGDTYRMYWDTIVFIWRCALIGVYDISTAPFSPYPGSELFHELQEKGVIPKKLDDAYFRSLPLADVTAVTSWCENISSAGLNRIRNVALLSFYLLSYSLRPWRLVRTISNFIAHRQESRLDRSLAEIRHRLVDLGKNKISRSFRFRGAINPF